jgi:uncharacterized glyoxalase superfamily protein PhnB
MANFEAIDLAVSLTVSDLAASRDWYRDAVGFVVAQVFERGGVMRAVRMNAGPISILLTQDDGTKGSDRIKGAGFSIQFTTRADIDALAARVVAHGTVLATEPADAFGARVFRVRDPDGFLLVFSSERSAA